MNGTSSTRRGAPGLVLGAMLLLALGACGGIVDYGPPPGTDDRGPAGDGPAAGGSAEPGDEPASGGRAASGDDSDRGRGGEKSPLGPCVEGFLRDENPTLPCNWLAEGRCYDDKLDACACICPRRGDSTCLSGFYGGDGSATAVSCS